MQSRRRLVRERLDTPPLHVFITEECSDWRRGGQMSELRSSEGTTQAPWWRCGGGVCHRLSARRLYVNEAKNTFPTFASAKKRAVNWSVL